MATAAQPRVSELGVLLIESDPLDASILTRLLRAVGGLPTSFTKNVQQLRRGTSNKTPFAPVIHSISRGELDARDPSGQAATPDRARPRERV